MPTARRTRPRGAWKSEARKHRRAWRKSGQTRVAYARNAGLAPSTFSRWLRNLDRLEGEGAAISVTTGSAGIAPAGRSREVATALASPARARLLEVQVAPWGECETGAAVAAAAVSTNDPPVEIALPSGIRIRYPTGVRSEALSALVGLLGREC